MASNAALEQARHLIGANIGQRILDSEDPPCAFLQIFAGGELPALHQMDEGQVWERPRGYCTVRRNVQIARGKTEAR